MAIDQPKIPEKPPHGAPCNQCGRCCEFALCSAATHVFKRNDVGPCPALEREDDGRARCGLVANPARYAHSRAKAIGEKRMAKAAMVLIGAGLGCDAQLDGEAADPTWRARAAAIRLQWRHEITKAGRAWNIPKRFFNGA